MEKLDDGETCANQALERLMCYLISPSYLPRVSWTGRGKGKERKVSLSACVQLVNFIVIVVNKIDGSFNHKKVVAELTYGLLKRAPTKFGKPKANNANDNSASIAEKCDEIVTKASNPVSDSNCALVTAQTNTLASTSASIHPASSSSLHEIPNHNYTQEQFKHMFMQQRALPPLNWWDSRYPPFVHPPTGPSQ